MIQETHAGVSAARNLGTQAAKYPWLLYLDADDLLLPRHLECMCAAVQADPELGAVICGWERLTPQGNHIQEEVWNQTGDLFEWLGRAAIFPIHACMVRKELVQEVGGWDASLRTCEDWDLWQRIARTGTRFGVAPQVLAVYRMNPRSASMDGARMLPDGLSVLSRGHAPDPRVSKPHPAHCDGLPSEGLASRQVYFLCWCAALEIGHHRETRDLFEVLDWKQEVDLDPAAIARSLFRGVLLPSGRPYEQWNQALLTLDSGINAFLAQLEARARQPGLRKSVRLLFEDLILDVTSTQSGTCVGLTCGYKIEITQPIPCLYPPSGVERVRCIVQVDGETLGVVVLPVFDGVVPAYVLSDVIAAEFSWKILERFLTATVYPSLRFEKAADGLVAWRGDLRLASRLPEERELLFPALHDKAGWLVFLQEVWGCPDQPQSWFYERGDPWASSQLGWLSSRIASFPWIPDRWRRAILGIWLMVRAWGSRLLQKRFKVQTVRAEGDWFVVEAGKPPADVLCSDLKLNVLFTVGGAAIGQAILPVEAGKVTARSLRSALIQDSGYELCCAVAREALLGRPFRDHGSLHARLAEALNSDRSLNYFPPQPSIIMADVESSLAPGWEVASRRALFPDSEGVILARRLSNYIGDSTARRAVLPACLFADLAELSARWGEPVLKFCPENEIPRRVVYTPEIVWHPGQALMPRAEKLSLLQSPEGLSDSEDVQEKGSPSLQTDAAGVFDRSHFETLFSAKDDPWGYTTPYEQIKYQQTLELLPEGRIEKALELACAEGHFTVLLAPRVGSLVASDISHIALQRAARRCADLPNVTFLPLDLVKDPLPVGFDLIVCSEVLYYVGDRSVLSAVAKKMAAVLNPGGYLLTAHAHLVVDEPKKPGYNWNHPFGAKVIGETLAAAGRLTLVKELRTPLYRIQLFQKDSSWRRFIGPITVHRTILKEQPAPPPPGAAEQVLWEGGRPSQWENEQVVTARLPVLMYHRICQGGANVRGVNIPMQRYQVTLAAFEEQLRYLREAGYVSISPEDWLGALHRRQPLPGRAILLTFDDGYADFADFAWPLLRRYGFSALVFLVAGEVGGFNRWDAELGETTPLMDWNTLRELRAEGVLFGSHGVSHTRLVSLSPVEIAAELIRSRNLLEDGLGGPMTAVAYPYGSANSLVYSLAGACGYRFGFTCLPGRSGLWDSPLALPRIEIQGTDGFDAFVRKLGE